MENGGRNVCQNDTSKYETMERDCEASYLGKCLVCFIYDNLYKAITGQR